jgi:hypothetical protein
MAACSSSGVRKDPQSRHRSTPLGSIIPHWGQGVSRLPPPDGPPSAMTEEAGGAAGTGSGGSSAPQSGHFFSSPITTDLHAGQSRRATSIKPTSHTTLPNDLPATPEHNLTRPFPDRSMLHAGHDLPPNFILTEGRLKSSRNTALAGQTAQRQEKSRSTVDRIRKLATNQRRRENFAGKKRPLPVKVWLFCGNSPVAQNFPNVDGEINDG